MKRNTSIKTLTFTVEELCQLLADHPANSSSRLTQTISEAANAPESTEPESADDNATRLILDKIREKAQRLNAQREKRRLRKQEAAKIAAAGKQSSEGGSTTLVPKKATLTLTRERAMTLLWLHNHANELKDRLTQLTRFASPLLPPASATTIIETLALLTRLANDSHPDLRSYLATRGNSLQQIEVRLQ